MNKLICPDCGQEVDMLMRTTKICVSCYKRKANKKYNHNEYIPLINLQGTTEYKRVMGRRKSHKANFEKNDKATISDDLIKATISNNEKYEYIDIAPDDIYNAINVLLKAVNNKDKIERLCTIVSEDLLVLSHKKENTDGPGSEDYNTLAIKEFILLKYRSKLKDLLVYLNVIKPEMFTDANLKNLQNIKTKLALNEYKPKYSLYNSYKVSVMVSGLNGNRNQEKFNRLVYASNVQEAKNYVKSFLSNLRSVTIFEKSWEIKEVEKNVDIKNNQEESKI